MNQIVKNIFAAGVVGAGGAGFPTHVKAQCKAGIVIANGAECEPLLSNDKLLLKTKAPEILEGLALMAKATGARRKVIAVKKKYRDVIDTLSKTVANYGVDIYPLHNYYPAGDEHEIVNYVTHNIVPEMGIPAQKGVVTSNIETLFNVAASQKGQSVTDRYVSLTGEIKQPAVYKVPIGTPVQTLLDSAGGVTCPQPSFILGGRLMGKLAIDTSEPITKTIGAVFVLPDSHPLIAHYRQSYRYSLLKARSACTQCTLCTDACSRHLLGHRLYPHKIMLLTDLALTVDSRLARSALLCSDCGCCEYACPMDLSPRKVIRVIKDHLKDSERQYPTNGYEPRLHPAREIRHIPVERIIQRLRVQEYAAIEPVLSKTRIVPDYVDIPLRQHIGQPAKPIVKKQRVSRGETIAAIRAGQLGANIHASVSGSVVSITSEMIRIKADK